MFDVSLSELMLISVIALIVIGPERLPKVARTIGHLVGRAQRYVTDVKTDIKREMDIEELSGIKSQMEDAAKSVKDSMKQASDTFRNPLEEAQQALKEASSSVGNLMDEVKHEVQADKAAAGTPDLDTSTLPLPGVPEPAPGTVANTNTDRDTATDKVNDDAKQPTNTTGTPT